MKLIELSITAVNTTNDLITCARFAGGEEIEEKDMAGSIGF